MIPGFGVRTAINLVTSGYTLVYLKAYALKLIIIILKLKLEQGVAHVCAILGDLTIFI